MTHYSSVFFAPLSIIHRNNLIENTKTKKSTQQPQELLLKCWIFLFSMEVYWSAFPSSLRTADVFPVVASLPPEEDKATTGNTSAVRRLLPKMQNKCSVNFENEFRFTKCFVIPCVPLKVWRESMRKSCYIGFLFECVCFVWNDRVCGRLLMEKISNDDGDQLATAMAKPRTFKEQFDTACTRRRIKFFILSKLGRR